MTPKQLAATLATLRWYPNTLAKAMDCNHRTVLDMLAGDRGIPAGVADWLMKAAAFLEAYPDPPPWRVLPGNASAPKNRIRGQHKRKWGKEDPQAEQDPKAPPEGGPEAVPEGPMPLAVPVALAVAAHEALTPELPQDVPESAPESAPESLPEGATPAPSPSVQSPETSPSPWRPPWLSD